MTQKIHQTKDGSTTLYSNTFDQYYHNPNGAVSESLYVFFEQSGLFEHLKTEQPTKILEIGFGTGLNFLLLLDHIITNDIQSPVEFYSVEAFPIEQHIAEKIDFAEHLNDPEINKLLPKIFADLKPGMNRIKPFSDLNVELMLFAGTFENFEPDNLSVDFIFHDAFSPEVNAELWTDKAFSKLTGFSHPGTVLTTYCAASKARAAMCVADWFVAKARGALGKREMTIASLSEEKLNNFKRINEIRMAERYKNNDFD